MKYGRPFDSNVLGLRVHTTWKAGRGSGPPSPLTDGCYRVGCLAASGFSDRVCVAGSPYSQTEVTNLIKPTIVIINNLNLHLVGKAMLIQGPKSGPSDLWNWFCGLCMSSTRTRFEASLCCLCQFIHIGNAWRLCKNPVLCSCEACPNRCICLDSKTEECGCTLALSTGGSSDYKHAVHKCLI